MRVLIVMPSGKYQGGAEEALIQLAEHRSELPFEIHIFFLESGDLVARIQQTGVSCTVHEAGRLRDPVRYITAVRTIRGTVATNHCDMVLGWMTKAHIYGGLAALWSRVSATYFQHGLPDNGRVDRIAHRIPCAGILTPSEFVAGMQRKASRVPVLSVPPGMDDARFDAKGLPSTADAKMQLGFGTDRPLVGIVGRLQRWKGIHTYLAAMAELLKANSSIQGVVVGGTHDLEPDYPDFLRSEAQRLDVSDAVRFVGAQDNVQCWMQAMDVIVHASDREPFGIVVVEAMALGKPVVASIPGGPEEIITHEEHGLLVPAGDSVGLAAAIRRFLSNSSLARQCGAAAQQRARQFTAAKFVQRFSQAVSALLSTRQSHVPNP